ncbi:MAG: hypothetical protein Q7T82_09775 [Armatimonadota bacterium]|nr:hypothetical protein [Armatimonadota bacterium]
MGKRLWTGEEVLSRIRSLSEAGGDLAPGTVAKIAPRLLSAACRYFGSWGQAVEAIGIDYSALLETAHRRAGENRSKWSRERILERIRALAEKNETLATTIVSLKYGDLYSAACSPRYFNGWAKAVEAAGIRVEQKKPGKPSKHLADLARWKANMLLERVYQIAGDGSTIDERLIRMLAPALHEATVKRFGSWARALEFRSSQIGDGNG